MGNMRIMRWNRHWHGWGRVVANSLCLLNRIEAFDISRFPTAGYIIDSCCDATSNHRIAPGICKSSLFVMNELFDGIGIFDGIGTCLTSHHGYRELLRY